MVCIARVSRVCLQLYRCHELPRVALDFALVQPVFAAGALARGLRASEGIVGNNEDEQLDVILQRRKLASKIIARDVAVDETQRRRAR